MNDEKPTGTIVMKGQEPEPPTAKELRKIKKDAYDDKRRINCFVKNWNTNGCKGCSMEDKCAEDDVLMKEAKDANDSD